MQERKPVEKIVNGDTPTSQVGSNIITQNHQISWFWVIISSKIISTTGIIKETCNLRGNPVDEVLIDLYHWCTKCNRIIAHDLNFDKGMIIIESIQN